MNRKVILLGITELFNQFGNRLTLFSGTIMLAFSSEQNKHLYLALLLTSQVFVSLLLVALKQTTILNQAFRKLILILASQALFLILLIIAPPSQALFVVLYFLKSSMNGIYHSIIESLLPIIEPNSEKWFNSSKVFSTLNSTQFLLSLILSGIIIQYADIKIAFFVDLITCVVPFLLFLHWNRSILFTKDCNEQSRSACEMNYKLKEIINVALPVKRMLINTFCLYLFSGSASMYELFYYKDSINLRPESVGYLFLVNGIGSVLGNIALTQPIANALSEKKEHLLFL